MPVNRILTTLLALAGCATSAQAQTANVQQYVRDHQPEIMREFIALVSLPNVRTDGQPVTDIASRRAFPDSWRLYARSVGDDKGPIQAFVSALDTLGGTPTHNIKVILHGEEEGSGPALDSIIKAHGDRLRSDVLVILDGPQHPSGNPTVYFGARGGASVDVTVYTAKSAMHSQHSDNENLRLGNLRDGIASLAAIMAR